jgi:FkbM family methyltransferase
MRVSRMMQTCPPVFRPLVRLSFRCGLRPPERANWIMDDVLQGLRPNVSEGVVRMRGGLRIRTELTGLYGLKLYFYGVANRLLVNAITSLLQPGHVFIDGGANIGELVLQAARRVGARGRVLAVEPVADVRRRLAENVALNQLNNIAIVDVALGGVDEQRTFFSGSGEYCADSSFMKPDSYSGRPVIVECLRLDTLIARERLERVDLLKLDLEGAEFEAVHGATELLSPGGRRPIVIFEYHAEASARAGWTLPQMAAFFADRDYAVHAVTPTGYGDPVDVEAVTQSVARGVPYLDLMAVPAEKANVRQSPDRA